MSFPEFLINCMICFVATSCMLILILTVFTKNSEKFKELFEKPIWAFFFFGSYSIFVGILQLENGEFCALFSLTVLVTAFLEKIGAKNKFT